MPSSVGVRKGSVIGVYLSSNNVMPVIGTGSVNNKIVGVCRTTANQFTEIVFCNETTHPNYILHAEADISKLLH